MLDKSSIDSGYKIVAGVFAAGVITVGGYRTVNAVTKTPEIVARHDSVSRVQADDLLAEVRQRQPRDRPGRVPRPGRPASFRLDPLRDWGGHTMTETEIKAKFQGWFATSFWVDVHYALAVVGTIHVLFQKPFDAGRAAFVAGMWITAVGNDKMNMPAVK